MKRVLSTMVAVGAVGLSPAPGADLEFKIGEARLKIGAHALQAESTAPRAQIEKKAGTARFLLSSGSVERLTENGKDIAWKAGAPPGYASLAWLGNDEATAYLRGYNDREEQADTRPDVHVLDLASGTWGPPLAIRPPEVTPIGAMVGTVPM